MDDFQTAMVRPPKDRVAAQRGADARARSDDGGVRLSADAGIAGERLFRWKAGGWTVRTANRPILGTHAIYAWKRELKCYRGQHLPEALFGESLLELRHDTSGVTIRFSALEALRSWAAFGLPPVRVAKARGSKFWEGAQASMSGGDWDYTFTSPYCGSTLISSSSSPSFLRSPLPSPSTSSSSSSSSSTSSPLHFSSSLSALFSSPIMACPRPDTSTFFSQPAWDLVVLRDGKGADRSPQQQNG